jgi:hypothetical protein
MDTQTRDRLTAMLQEVRGWTDAPEGAVDDLAARHRLNPLMVRRILEAEFGTQGPSATLLDPDSPTRRTIEISAVDDD